MHRGARSDGDRGIIQVRITMVGMRAPPGMGIRVVTVMGIRVVAVMGAECK